MNNYFDTFGASESEIPDTPLERAYALQNGLIADATGSGFEGGDKLFKAFRNEFKSDVQTGKLIPSFLVRTRDLAQFWQFIKYKFPTYAERREYIYAEFAPLLDFLEGNNQAPHDSTVEKAFDEFVPGDIPQIWKRALERRENDPAGAITLARTLLESVCKYILEDEGIAYKADTDLPRLWTLCAEQLNMAPSQHTEEIFKSILGSCQNIVGSLGSLRNRISDSHGQGKLPVKPQPRHAELTVNLAGSMAQFLVATWENKKSN